MVRTVLRGRRLGLAVGLVLAASTAHAANGIVIGHIGGNLSLDQAQAMVRKLIGWADAAQGNVILLSCPAEWKTQLPIWGTPRGDEWLMRTVKEKLDPSNIFNPGRFF